MQAPRTAPSAAIGRWLAAHPSLVMAALMVVLLLTIAALRWKSSAEELRISIQTSTQAANETLTRVFANEHWLAVRPLLPAPDSDAATVRANPGIEEIDQIVRRFSRTTDVLKVKIYRLDGMTVYSSERAQIGEDKSGNQGFQTAARGQTVSELTTRGRFGGFDGELYDRDLVASYVPLRQQGRIEAVLEIYSDRTESITLIGREVRQMSTTVLPLLGGMLLLTVVTGAVLQRMNARLIRTAGAEAPGSAPGPSVSLADGSTGRIWSPGVQQPVSPAVAALAARMGTLLQGLGRREATLAADPTTVTELRELHALAVRVAHWVDTIDGLERLGLAPSASARDPSEQALSIDGLLEGLVAAHAPAAASKGLSLSLYGYPQPLGEATGDADSIRTLLNHLLGSAVDATEEGRIEVKATRTADGLRVDVIDSSPGLSQTRIDELCAAWDTGVLAAPQASGLAGLRLVLCHALARHLGGRTEFRSTPGHGSRLTAEIPLSGI